MADDPRFLREREIAERRTAATTSLLNVRTQSLRAAERWSELADKAERAQAGAALRDAEREKSKI